jgi:hypothetical protein
VFVSINCSVEIVTEETDTLTRTAVVITKLNSSGVVQWTRRVGPGPCASVGTGIDCDSLGNVYLSALTTAQKNPTRDNENFDPFDFRVARDVLAIAKYSTSGVVLWQRYIEADGYEFYQSRSVDNFVPATLSMMSTQAAIYLSAPLASWLSRPLCLSVI